MKDVTVSTAELYLLASEMVMENMPLGDGTLFNPRDKDECVDKLMDLVKAKDLSIDWIKTAAEANISNNHCLITFDDKTRRWNLIKGMNRTFHSREDFLDKVTDYSKAVREGKVKGISKSKSKKWGKDFFNKNKR